MAKGRTAEEIVKRSGADIEVIETAFDAVDVVDKKESSDS